jgi:hypothetical protein
VAGEETTREGGRGFSDLASAMSCHVDARALHTTLCDFFVCLWCVCAQELAIAHVELANPATPLVECCEGRYSERPPSFAKSLRDCFQGRFFLLQ